MILGFQMSMSAFIHSSDIHKILDGIGDKFGTFVQMLTAFVAAFIQGFAIGWKLSCVMLVIVPVLTGAAMVASVVSRTNCPATSKVKFNSMQETSIRISMTFIVSD